ncbi:MAG: tetratricopeptide repeat protein, partial [bacterium]|nr:tetratricopeptide repeat protein [bacterium]
GVRSQKSEVRSQESGVRSQKSGVRSQESGVRSQEFAFYIPHSAFCIPQFSLGLFLLLAILSTALSPYKLASLYELANLTSYALLFWIVLVSVKDTRTVYLLLKVLLGVSLPVSLYGFAQSFGYDIFTGSGGVTSTFGNSNFLAGFLVVVIPLAISDFGFRISEQKIHNPQSAIRNPQLLLSLLLIVCLGLTQTRGAWIAFIVEIVLLAVGLLFLSQSAIPGTHEVGAQSAIGTIRSPLVVTGLIFLLSIGLLFVMRPGTIQRITSIADPANFDLTPSPAGVKGSIQVRLFIWQGALKMFAAAPVLGHGLGTFMLNFPQFRPAGFHSGGLGHNTYHAHSEYLEILAEMGILGLLAFLAFIFSCLWIGVKNCGLRIADCGLQNAENRSQKSEARGQKSEIRNPQSAIRNRDNPQSAIFWGCLVSIVGLLVHSAFTVDLRFTSGIYLWLLLGLVVVMARQEAEVRSQKSEVRGQKRNPKSEIRNPKSEIRNPKSEQSAIQNLLAFSLALLLLILLIPFIIRPARASIHLKQGDIAERSGDYATAIREYEQAVSISPVCYPAYYKAGYLYVEKIPDEKKAMATYQKLIKYAPNYAQVHYNLGLLYRKMGDLTQARDELKQCLKNNPYHKGVHFNLGVTHLDLGELRKAEAEFQTTLELDPQDAASMERLVSIYFQQKQWDEAITQSEKLIRVQPENAAAYSNLGAVYSEKGNKEKAYYYLKKAVEIDQDFLVGHQNLWLFLNKEGRAEEAAKEYQKMLQLKSGG